MTHLGYLLAGWGITLGALGLYAFRLSVRGRVLAGRVPAERRRWMTAEEDS
ncbi:MAG: hypothetical protein AAGE98_06770 [Actinomycetota bacterium]